MGLGDSLYLQGVVRYFVDKGEQLEVCSKWPDVFRQYGDQVRVVPFRRDNIQILAHYSLRKSRTDTNQWQDCCKQAGIHEPWELKLDWPTQEVKVKPYICLALPRIPMDRLDGIGTSLMPDYRATQHCIDVLRQKYQIVQIGAGKALYQFDGIDIDLANKTTVSDLLDVASTASGFLGYCSFIVPLAESFSKPALIVWAHKGLKDRYSYVRQITAKKILSKASSKWVMDNATEAEIDAAASAFL
jgi:hypothetical protein